MAAQSGKAQRDRERAAGAAAKALRQAESLVKQLEKRKAKFARGALGGTSASVQVHAAPPAQRVSALPPLLCALCRVPTAPPPRLAVERLDAFAARGRASACGSQWLPVSAAGAARCDVAQVQDDLDSARAG